MSVTNTRFFPFLDQFGPVFPVFGLKIIQKWYDFGQNSLFTLLDGQKQDFWGRMDRKMEKRFFFSVLIIAFGTNWDPFPDLFGPLWTYFFRFRTRLTFFFPFLGWISSKIYKLDSKYGSGTPWNWVKISLASWLYCVSVIRAIRAIKSLSRFLNSVSMGNRARNYTDTV